MKDGEVVLWLTDAEHLDWVAAENAGSDEMAHAVWRHLRTLAETRKALAAVCDDDWNADGFCVLCAGSKFGEGHARDCVFAAMPRPR